jgi:uncharacterized ferritin-like protein (DUF455 family)
MTSYSDYAQRILLGESLDDKFLDTPISWNQWREFQLPAKPGRMGRIKFSELQLKFPKASRLNEADKKAMALHSFANHELLAIEMMAAALLIYPHVTDEDLRFKKGILTALKDEQKHLNLYIKRLNELGYEFGDFPLNDFFWRQMQALTTKESYLSVMALTFESANLDFAAYYANLFRSFGDEKTAQILEAVLDDELTHVAFGASWMKRWKGERELWDYYIQTLPWPLTPARSKGIGFNPKLHGRAINDHSFITELTNYQDSFRITRRQENEGA